MDNPAGLMISTLSARYAPGEIHRTTDNRCDLIPAEQRIKNQIIVITGLSNQGNNVNDCK
ncbi:MAG: hypothetical protein Kow0075_07010 [Salibacteraceae bacterium]